MDDLSPRIAEFKQRVKKEWAVDETAAAWQKHYPAMRDQLALVTQALVDAAAPRTGMSVLDLASGTGEPAIPLAKAVAPTGRVTATDLSDAMLAALRTNADAAGVSNIETRACDCTDLPFVDASFDLVSSRFGIMFFAEVDRALAEIRRVLVSDGRIALMVWGPPVPGSYFGESAMPYVRRLPQPPDPDGPGPMRFAEPGKLARIVEAAGFTEIQEVNHNLPAPFRGTPEQLLSSLMEIAAPLRMAVAGLPESVRRTAEQEALDNLRPRFDGAYTTLSAPVHIVTGTAP